MVKGCDKQWWMIGSAAPAMKKRISVPLKWVAVNKLREFLQIKDKIVVLTRLVNKHVHRYCMKIFITGTRGIPDIPGGVEKHCQELYPLIAAMGHEVTVATRSPYVKDPRPNWKWIQLKHIFAPHKKSLEAIVHTFFAVLAARIQKVDIIHIHAVGPGLMVPLARILGMKVIITNHGPDYDRQKWGGGAAKTILRLGEYLGGKFANEVIVISTVIADIIKKRCGRSSTLIYNGVPLPDKSSETSFLEPLGIQAGKYIVSVARFVPEKGLHDLLEAFTRIQTDYQLVLAGDADHETEYSAELKKIAAADSRVVLTGYVTGEDLNQVFSHASLFVMPSYHENLPIALLEAMSYNLPVLVSDIPANKEINIDKNRFFQCGNIEELAEKMLLFLKKGLSDKEKAHFQRQIVDKYNWPVIAQKTVSVYEKALQ